MSGGLLGVLYTGIVSDSRQIVLTEERNCLALWDCKKKPGAKDDNVLLRSFPSWLRDVAMEESVRMADEIRRQSIGDCERPQELRKK